MLTGMLILWSIEWERPECGAVLCCAYSRVSGFVGTNRFLALIVSGKLANIPSVRV